MDWTQELTEAVVRGDDETVVAVVRRQLELGLSASEVLDDGLMTAMDEVGRRMEAQDMFIPEVLRAAVTMEAGLRELRPLLTRGPAETKGTILMGTVADDMHDIGKNLVVTLLQAAGFTVVDLGIDVSPERFVEETKRHAPDVLAMSALLTTTMSMMATTIAALKEAGLRDQVKVIVGGAPLDAEFAESIGADGYGSDAGAAIRLASQFCL